MSLVRLGAVLYSRSGVCVWGGGAGNQCESSQVGSCPLGQVGGGQGISESSQVGSCPLGQVWGGGRESV